MSTNAYPVQLTIDYPDRPLSRVVQRLPHKIPGTRKKTKNSIKDSTNSTRLN